MDDESREMHEKINEIQQQTARIEQQTSRIETIDSKANKAMGRANRADVKADSNRSNIKAIWVLISGIIIGMIPIVYKLFIEVVA